MLKYLNNVVQAEPIEATRLIHHLNKILAILVTELVTLFKTKFLLINEKE